VIRLARFFLSDTVRIKLKDSAHLATVINDSRVTYSSNGGRVIDVDRQMSNFAAISWRKQSDYDVLDQHA